MSAKYMLCTRISYAIKKLFKLIKSASVRFPCTATRAILALTATLQKWEGFRICCLATTWMFITGDAVGAGGNNGWYKLFGENRYRRTESRTARKAPAVQGTCQSDIKPSSISWLDYSGWFSKKRS